MFTHDSLKRKNPWFKTGLWAALALVMTALVFTGCPQPTEPEVTPPAKPVITGVAPSYKALTVTWGTVSGAASYEVYHNTTNTTTGATKFGGDITGTTETITGLTNGTTYYVWVKAKNSAGVSDFSVSSSGTPAIQAPAVTIVAANGELTVSWPAVTGATGYTVYHNTSDTTEDVQSTSVTDTSATISSLTNGTVYYIWVEATNEEDAPVRSAGQTAIPYDPAPLTALGGNWITGSDSYTITTDPVTVTYDDGGDYGTGFTGTIKYVTSFSSGEGDASGLIIVQYTTPPTSDYSIPNHPTGYQAIYYKGTPAAGPLQFANAYNVTAQGGAVDEATLEGAFTAFTETGYYATYIGDWWATKAYNSRYDNVYVTPNLQTALADFTGVWDSYSDGYVISFLSLEYDDGSNGLWGMNFAGNIKYVSAYGTDTGVIIIEYTEEPSMSYATGTSDYEGIYYKKIADDTIKFANAYDATGTDTLSLAAAIVKFSQTNESTFVANWDGVYAQFKQPNTTPVDMGGLRGNWKGDDDLTNMGVTDDSTWLKITDYRLTVYWGSISPLSPAYSGTIVHSTDTTADSGFIYIQFTQAKDAGLVELVYEADDGDFLNYYYAIRWEKDGAKYKFSVYNDHDDVVGSNLETLKGYSENPQFLEVDDDDYEGYGGMIYYFSEEDVDNHIYVGFTKQ